MEEQPDMKHQRSLLTAAATAAAVAGWLAVQVVQAQQPGTLPGVEPLHESGQDVTPAFEGWYKNADGTVGILFGYMNRNLKQELDIPIGPNNKVEPGNADQGQPTHFYARRGWGVFTVTVPKDFKQKVTWTLSINGRTNAIPASLDPRWEIDALHEVAAGNTPPVIKFRDPGPSTQGPRPLVTTMAVTLPNTASLDVIATDDNKNRSRNYSGPPVTVTWSRYRGPAAVTFEKAKPPVDKDTHHATTSATFSEPGEYWLRVVANDSSGDGGGGFQCCWTNGLVKVTVTGAATR
jgi:hypothetical protein